VKREGSPFPSGLDPAGFTVADAAGAGVGRGRLRASDLERPHYGVRVVKGNAPLDHLARAKAYAARMPDEAFFSHTTAALALGTPLPKFVADEPIHVSVFAPAQPREGKRIVGHRFRERFPLQTHSGLRVPTAPRVWLQLAALLELDELIIAGDYFVTGIEPYRRKRKPLASIAQLEASVALVGRARGIRNARAALPQIRYGPLSAQETRLRLLIVRAGLPEPVLNHKVLTGYGYIEAMIDLAYPGLMVGIEYQGEDHWKNAKVYRNDLIRRERLADAGWDMIYVTADDLFLRPGETIDRIRSRIERALRTGKRL
jgi:hypothetical protein